ncbi:MULTISPECIES: hypothetical protein [Flavobacterium]|uniref:DinB family protein n=2 Tax=Flavobacterium TaxID=237 RepID=A0AA94JN30_9FLAO|nr:MULTISPECIES: hypothetical protein [Flavobacterium]OXA73582.1 hypothetical protein B0A56_13225 [Flavobacterium columnare NBRC 100251 = ATCC 23463]AMA48698.1 hypothetical protein AWN65_04085 [Flavobacterium covae]AND65166.1 hypothetical protein AX766_12625 [Flavobacterium covae]MCH4830652.1 DinB family protein [Flavobacterium columnare]MCH4833411.1 DinB family protein [Flavobacterium columnare]
MNFTSVKNRLIELKEIMIQLNDCDFIIPISSLSNATIGEHIRHIIELYQALLKGYDNNIINYDTRERDVSIQTVKKCAISAIDLIINEIEKENKKLIIEHFISGIPTFIETNYFREVLYNLEHCIHHQALIKVALLNFNYIQISETFGIAPSTIEFRKICAQ